MRSAQSYPESSKGRAQVSVGFDLINAPLPLTRSRFVARISSRITTVIRVFPRSNEP